MQTFKGRKPGQQQSQNQQQSELIERIININRVTKVTKGGKKLHFTALVIVGDGNGHVAYGLGKANDVASAIRKSISKAKRQMIFVPRVDTSIPHEILAEFGAAKVLLKPARPGTGIIAAGPVRAACEAAGIKDILTKCLTSNNPINVVKATIQGFQDLKSPEE